MTSARRAVAGDVVAVLGTFAVLGAVCGVAWWLVVDPAVYTKAADGGAVMSELEMAKRFRADGWYAVLAVVAGFLAGLVVTAWRSRDQLLTTLLLVPGAAAAAVVSAAVGRLLGPEPHETVLARAAEGARVPVELTVSSAAIYLLWPVAVLAGAVLVLWSSPRVPRPAPASPVVTGPGPAVDQESSRNGHEPHQRSP